MSDDARQGRATHRVVIAQCTNSKRDGEHPARLLYDESGYFMKQRHYAEAAADQWFIQSAEYGLVHPDEEIPNYDTHASDLEDPDAWAEEIAADLDAAVPDDAVVEVLGGKAYADPLTPALEAKGYEVHEPLRGQRIGTRKQTLGRMYNSKLEAYA
jgi:hypothetical protein